MAPAGSAKIQQQAAKAAAAMVGGANSTGMMDSFRKQIADHNKSVTANFSFFSAVDWTEPFIVVLLAFQILVFCMVILSRKSPNIQACILLAIITVVRFAEKINEYCSEHFSTFSSVNYFDSNGLFMSVVFSGPLVIDCAIIAVLQIMETGNLLVQVKQAEMRANAKKKSEDDNDGGKVETTGDDMSGETGDKSAHSTTAKSTRRRARGSNKRE